MSWWGGRSRLTCLRLLVKQRTWSSLGGMVIREVLLLVLYVTNARERCLIVEMLVDCENDDGETRH